MKTFQIFIATSFIVLQSISHTVVAETELPQTTVAQKEVSRELKFTGTVEAVNQGTASSQTSGRVIATLVDVGDLVAKDDVILQLRDNQQRANLQTAEAGVRAAQAQFDSAQKENLRIQEIRKKELVSQSVADNALASRDAAKANLDAAKGRLKDSEEQLEFTRIRAPYSGIVLERHVEVGETVNPGTPLYTGMSLEFLRVLADVPQKDIDAIREYKQARIELKDSAVTIQGDALTFFGYADPQTSTFKVRAALPAGTAGLYPGMYVA
ncbi:MAG: efflux RND transporter periplasmic adaptor subunit, partial [Enterobacterales bacterium]|nr:efflux RND transporter periplasmic adaptor subunit [Enterobacterales bacterium]